MSGIAELLANLGYEVSGSDLHHSVTTERLASLGVRVHVGHAAAHVVGADVVVTSSAVRPDNVELREAGRCQIPVIPRAEMLAELMRLRFGIAVAGAHGKTSTTSMVACVLEHAGLDPTAVIGGRVAAFGSNARLGQSEYIVVEADESDRSFLRLSPSIAVITNVDREHLESYRDFDHLIEAFLDFANKVPFYGAVVCCLDDARLRDLVAKMNRRVITYGLDPAADVCGYDEELLPDRSGCMVRQRTGPGDIEPLGALELHLPGRYNLRNALAAVAVGLELGVTFPQIAEALRVFQGVDRRLQSYGVVDDISIVDDYAHHPTEIQAVLEAVRVGRSGRTLAVFQPHRYSRTSRLLPEFGRALALADEIVLTDIYGAGEQPVAGIDAHAVAASVRREHPEGVHVVGALERVAPVVAGLARAGDLIITLGAGSVGTVPQAIVAELERLRDRRWTS